MPDNSEPRKLSRWPEVVLVCIVVLLIFVSVFAKRQYVIGLVNVDRVAEVCGASQAIAESFRQWDEQVNARLLERRQQYQTESQALVRKLRSETSAAGRKRVRTELNRLRKAYEIDVFAMQTDRQRFRMARLRAFRLALRPLAAEVAKKRRVEIVFADGEHVLACAQGVDLTAEVSELAKENLPSLEQAISPPAMTSDVPVVVEPGEGEETGHTNSVVGAPDTP
jgi:Skp family chaperone for outer membrane proteins